MMMIIYLLTRLKDKLSKVDDGGKPRVLGADKVGILAKIEDRRKR